MRHACVLCEEGGAGSRWHAPACATAAVAGRHPGAGGGRHHVYQGADSKAVGRGVMKATAVLAQGRRVALRARTHRVGVCLCCVLSASSMATTPAPSSCVRADTCMCLVQTQLEGVPAAASHCTIVFHISRLGHQAVDITRGRLQPACVLLAVDCAPGGVLARQQPCIKGCGHRSHPLRNLVPILTACL